MAFCLLKFRHNMTEYDEPIIRFLTASELERGDYVQMTFSPPDLEMFNMTKTDDDIISLFPNVPMINLLSSMMMPMI